MDPVTLKALMTAAQVAQGQIRLAAKLAELNLEQERMIGDILEAVAANGARLAAAPPPGQGTKVDRTS